MTVVARSVFDVLDYEIKHGTQRSTGVLYVIALIALVNDKETCLRINTAIETRWSFRGLNNVKKIAWEIHSAMIEAEKGTGR